MVKYFLKYSTMGFIFCFLYAFGMSELDQNFELIFIEEELEESKEDENFSLNFNFNDPEIQALLEKPQQNESENSTQKKNTHIVQKNNAFFCTICEKYLDNVGTHLGGLEHRINVYYNKGKSVFKIERTNPIFCNHGCDYISYDIYELAWHVYTQHMIKGIFSTKKCYLCCDDITLGGKNSHIFKHIANGRYFKCPEQSCKTVSKNIETILKHIKSCTHCKKLRNDLKISTKISKKYNKNNHNKNIEFISENIDELKDNAN